MANIVTYPLNKIEYQATDAELFHATRTSGVYANTDFNCSVTGADNTVTVETGIAWIKNSQFSGKVAANKSAETVDLGVADASLPRWDVVCLQFDKNKNATDIVVKKGNPSSSPVMPAIVQTETLYELYLCKVYRPAGAVAISTNDVYDLRLDPELCGLMADSVTSVDTSAINAQINALIKQLKEEIENATSVDKGINTYTASGTVNDFTLTGIGENGKFKANFTGLISSVAINGEEYTVLAGNETEIELSINSWYTFVLDLVAKTINFKSGGGLSNSKLALATATTGDTLSGKTFYSGDKTLKTGTLALSGNAAVSDVLTGKTFYNTNAKSKQTGTIPSKAAATYGAKTSAQTIAAGQYLSGAQTIAAVTQTNLTAANIVKGKTVTIKSNNANLWNITGTGTTAPTSSTLLHSYFTANGAKTTTYTSTVSGIVIVFATYACEETGWGEALNITVNGCTATQLALNETSNSNSYCKTRVWLVTSVSSGDTITVSNDNSKSYGSPEFHVYMVQPKA